MRVAHFDCFSGISGDMTLGAVVDAGVPIDAIRAAIDSMKLPIRLEAERVKRCGFAATKVTVEAKDEEEYRFLPDVEKIVVAASITPRQRESAMGIFRRIAEAEAKAHGMPLERVHFHEVGALDSIADIVGAAVGLDLLGVARFTSSRVPTGTGTVKCAHGVMPVPTPATAELLKGVPLAPNPTAFELTTPTGAAIVTVFATEFTDAPAMTIDRIGTGAGTKDFLDRPNILRLLVGTAADVSDSVWVLETNLDDCPAELIGYATERLFAAGAVDVFCTPIQMKKNRPGVLLTALVKAAERDAVEEVLFRETGTFGVRRTLAERTILHREETTLPTPWGPVRGKRGRRGGHEILSPEYEDCARLARETGVPLREVYAAVIAAAPQTP